ncbi:MAG: TIGR02206 family membrane protein [bacterium]
MFGPQHLWAMAVIFAITMLLPLAVKRMQSERTTRAIALSLAWLLLLAKVVEPIYRISMGEVWKDVLPLHLCDIGAVLAGIMLINRNYFLYELTYFWGLGGTLQAILTPTLQNGFPHLDFWYYFVNHALIIIAAIYATVLFRFRPTLKSTWRAFKTTLVVALLIAPINWLLNTNYLYLCAKPHSASLLDYLGGWPWYILSLLPVCLFTFFVYYSPFWLVERVRNRMQKNH